MPKPRKTPKWLKFDPASNSLRPTRRFEGGAYDALGRRPVSLLKPNCLYRRILSVLAGYKNEPLMTKQITELHNARYTDNVTKAQSINARLSELFTYGLVQHYESADHAGAGYWSIADGVDASDGKALYDRALRHVRQLKSGKRSDLYALPEPPNKRLLRE